MKNLKSLKTILKKKQKAFSKMSLTEKRIAIAKDVIERIRIGQFFPEQGIFCEMGGLSLPSNLNRVGLGFDKENKPIFITEVCDIVNANKTCSVCAKGGLFMSLIGYVDNFKIDDLHYGARSSVDLKNKEMKTLSRIFSPKQLSMIETAFEGTTYSWNLILSDDERRKCGDLYDLYDEDDSRLIGICENIINNKGVFKP